MQAPSSQAVVLSLCQIPKVIAHFSYFDSLTPTRGPIFGIGVPTSSSAAMVESLRGLIVEACFGGRELLKSDFSSLCTRIMLDFDACYA